jgi:hypothetical protein
MDASRRVTFLANPLWQFEDAPRLTNVNIGRTLPIRKSDEEVSWSRDPLDGLQQLLAISLPKLAVTSLPKVEAEVEFDM